MTITRTKLKNVIGITLSAVLFMLPAAEAASSSAIKAELDVALEKQEIAHQLAECARSLGEDESHETIQYAKLKWREQQNIIDELWQEYRLAVNKEKAAEQEKRGTYLGCFRISHYCPCAVCNGGWGATTAVGAPLTVGKTIAVDPSIIPLGSTVYIEGYGNRVAQDTGGAIKGNRIDLLVDSHSEAYAKGIKYLDVYIK